MSPFASFEDFPLADTLDEGRFCPDEHYLGLGADKLYFGHSPTHAGRRYLISISPNNGVEMELLRTEIMHPAQGVFAPVFLGLFDADGRNPERDARRRVEVGFVEELPDGGPITRLAHVARQHAARLGAQVGRILTGLLASRGEHLLGLRPEYVWVRSDGDEPNVTGIGGRNTTFFASASRNRDLPTARLFTRKYFAPEVSRGEPFDDRALVLTLAVMVAEWATGEYPYPSDAAYGYWNLCAGRYRELELPTVFRNLLVHGMQPARDARPSLAAFVDSLEAIAE